MYKIEAIVKFNDSEALVLNKMPDIKYDNYGNYLFGLDECGVFVNVYKFKMSSGRFKAFSGKDFRIPMFDGSFVEAKGQWWDAGTSALEDVLGSKVIGVTISTKEDLSKCYVFYGMKADADEYQKLRNTYSGKIYDYYEYEKLLIKKT